MTGRASGCAPSGRTTSPSRRLQAIACRAAGSYDFVQDRTHDGRAFRTLNIIDEYTKEALMIRVDRKLNSTDVLDALTNLFILRGPPEYIRSDNGPEFIAQKVRDWIAAVGAKTAYIEPFVGELIPQINF